MAPARILVVDDEADILRIVHLSLLRWGYDVESFMDPAAALEHFKQNASKYSLIITDIRMPGMTGDELARRARKIRPGIKVMVMTAFEMDRELRRALPSIDSNGFLQKPFHVSDVCVAVRKHLAASAS